ncbi:MAG: RluA family pseudouridine synthase [Spirochaetaceae bacterium]|jgi:23S rRNA pseudouridine955/2504/2580 synthase|nr:RluA family pseudouridine synthase [Spirochaetaceae bacterium]
MKDIPVVFENEDCIVFNKPAGLAVQGGAGVGASLDRLIAERWSPRPLLVHRLDKDTSGLILVAKHKLGAVRFSRLFSREKGTGLVKQYLAVCAGSPERSAGAIRFDLDIRGAVKRSETVYRRVSGNGGFSLLELELGTGRMHQIRRHLAELGHPVLGDDKYGDFRLNKALRKTAGLKRLLLHAARLIFADTEPDFPAVLSAPLPEHFAEFLRRSGIASG